MKLVSRAGVVVALLLLAACSGGLQSSAAADDPYLWLEEIDGERPLAWVRAENARTAAAQEGTAEYRALEADVLAVLDSTEKIPYVTKAGGFYYNLWRDAAHPRGLWRRTTLDEYREAAPAWETVLDVDALGAAEGQSWVFHGAVFLKPGYERCLLLLSPGGSDAEAVREFDVTAKAFVAGGFEVPVAKSDVSWLDADTLYVGTDFGPGSLTTSGYARVVKRWRRGTPLAEAVTVFEGQATDMVALVVHDRTPGFERSLAIRKPSFFTQETFVLDRDGARQRLDVPADVRVDVQREWLLLWPRADWQVGGATHPAGSLLAARLDAFLAGDRRLDVLFAPDDASALTGFAWTRHHLVLNVMHHVATHLEVLTPEAAAWTHSAFPGLPPFATVGVLGVDADLSDDVFVTTTDFLTPETLLLATVGRPPERLKSAPAFFDASGLEVRQFFATSRDGTRVPYFQVAPKGLPSDGRAPTLLSGYGGFEIPRLPRYSGTLGRAWLSKGGVYVLANLRGGGEYGPRWHQAALKANRPRAYEDFEAVARDLIARGVTSPRHLGIEGGSNGGLLVGNMLTRTPELFGAIVCQVPLLDMKRYSHLLAGASWIEEYGDPDKPEEWAFLRTFSPYHNLVEGAVYPPVLFMTTTRDDRVHPGHARKMMAKMADLGHDVTYFENVEGGHGAGADNRQTAHFWALAFTFLGQRLR